MYILTEGGRSFKTLLKENYAIALDSCYLFTKKFTGDLIDETFLAIYTDDEFDSLLFCNIVRFFVICLCGGKFLTSLDGSRILGSIGIS